MGPTETEAAPGMERLVGIGITWQTVGRVTILLALRAKPIELFIHEPDVAPMVVAGGLTFAIYAVGSLRMTICMRGLKLRSIELRNWIGLLAGSIVAIVVAVAVAVAWALLDARRWRAVLQPEHG